MDERHDRITLFFPGNKNSPYDTRIYPHFSKSILIINYRDRQKDGNFYGIGNPQTAIQNAKDAYEYANYKYRQINVVCFSMGCAVFSEIYVDIVKNDWKRPERIINIAGFPNIGDMLHHYMSYFSALLLPFLRHFHSEKNYMNHLDAPMIMIYSVHDEIIPFYIGKKMYESLFMNKKDVQFLTVYGIKHNDFNIYKYLE
jgi:esterase/lipase